jgi:hypothetical protein
MTLRKLFLLILLWASLLVPVPDVRAQPATQTAQDSKSATVYVTRTGKKYHTAECRYLKSKIKTTVKEAQANGYTPCKVCHPPQ